MSNYRIYLFFLHATKKIKQISNLKRKKRFLLAVKDYFGVSGLVL